uniref:Uncharacterized protein n=1 Tax=Arundo donax TaxID=35708 RepID=A0A0A9FKM8_ARUDO
MMVTGCLSGMSRGSKFFILVCPHLLSYLLNQDQMKSSNVQTSVSYVALSIIPAGCLLSHASA